MTDTDVALIAHLMRRAGFGTTSAELEHHAAQGYEATVEELLHPEGMPALGDEDLNRRFHVTHTNFYPVTSCQMYWLRRMINTRRPLEEKMALFWHGIFATGYTKLFQARAVLQQVDTLRRHGLGSFHTLLMELSKDPSMIFWLDNKDNHRDAVNENYGRELLELFAMGVGNYTEDDVRQASRAFTGWTVRDAAYHAAKAERCSVWPYGDLAPEFQYRNDDHDDGEKEFLGHTGQFDGDEIIDIICEQPAAAGFIARHLYTFFVADEPQVPAWNETPPADPDAIETLVSAYFDGGYDMRSVLRVLFNSDFFKNAIYDKVKSPTELVVGTARLAGGFEFPHMDDVKLASETAVMGQSLLDPPSVEGWHTGEEWVNTASLMNRVNFAADLLSDAGRPGVRSIVEKTLEDGSDGTPERLVRRCLELMGIFGLSDVARAELVDNATVAFNGGSNGNREAKVQTVLRLIAAMPEYQLE